MRAPGWEDTLCTSLCCYRTLYCKCHFLLRMNFNLLLTHPVYCPPWVARDLSVPSAGSQAEPTATAVIRPWRHSPLRGLLGWQGHPLLLPFCICRQGLSPLSATPPPSSWV